MHHKKFLFIAISSAAVLAITIATMVSSRRITAESIRENAGPGAPRLSDTDGEVTATLPLFHRVDVNYTRGSQPLRGGMRTLTRLGVKTVVDLRSIYDNYTDEVKTSAAAAGLGYEWVPMSVWDPPTDDEANRFVSVVSDTTKGPFFVFCADGLNRIGEMTAIYRVAHSKWGVDKALEEADQLGFNPYYYTLRNYVWDYARKFQSSAVPRAGRRVSPLEP